MVDLYAGLYVRNYETARDWYTLLLGAGPSFVATPTEAVWELATNRSLFIEENADHAGHGVVSIFVDGLDEWVASISRRGLEPAQRLTYGNGVRKALYRDPDGNEIGFGGAPIG